MKRFLLNLLCLACVSTVCANVPVRVELSFKNYGDSVVQPGNGFSFEVNLVNASTVSQIGVVKLSVLDLYEKKVADLPDIPFTIPASGTSVKESTAAVDKYGVFKIRAVVEVGGTKSERDITSFACLPVDPPPSHPFFGIHTIANPIMSSFYRQLGFSRNRVHNMTQFTWWVRVQPEKDSWEWRGAEDYDTLKKQGYTCYGQWYGTPYWAAGNEASAPVSPTEYPKPWVPKDAEAFRKYIRETIKHFPDIKEWEIWNECWVSKFWLGTPEAYVDLCRMAFEEAKKTDPSVRVIAMLRADHSWVDKCLKAGVLDYCDAVSFHGLRIEASDHPQKARWYVKRLKEQLAHYRKDVPLIWSEPKLMTTTFLKGLNFPEIPQADLARKIDAVSAARFAVQYRVVLMAEGVEATYAYQGNPLDPKRAAAKAARNYYTTEVTRTPKPDLIATSVLIRQLDGGVFLKEFQLEPGVPVFLFKRADGDLLAILWGEDGAQIDLSTPLPAFDIMGNPLEAHSVKVGPDVVYLRGSGTEKEIEQSLLGAKWKTISGARPAEPITSFKDPNRNFVE